MVGVVREKRAGGWEKYGREECERGRAGKVRERESRGMGELWGGKKSMKEGAWE